MSGAWGDRKILDPLVPAKAGTQGSQPQIFAFEPEGAARMNGLEGRDIQKSSDSGDIPSFAKPVRAARLVGTLVGRDAD